MVSILTVKSFLVIMFCLAVCVSGAGKYKLKQKPNGLASLFRSKMYLEAEQLDVGKKEREKLFKKYKETKVYSETRGKPKLKSSASKSEQEQGDFDLLQNEIAKLSNKFETNTKDTGELPDSLICLKRGALKEKGAEEEEKNQNERKAKQRGLSLQDLVTYFRMTDRQNQKNINTIVSNQENILSKLDKILFNEGYSMRKDYARLEDKLDRHAAFSPTFEVTG